MPPTPNTWTAPPAASGTPALDGWQALPELANVYWRPRVSERSLGRSGRLWTLVTIAHSVPFVGAALLLGVLKPITLPVGLALLAHAWVIPKLYAARGAAVLRSGPGSGTGGDGEAAERVAMGLLADLVAHSPRELLARTGLVVERGRFGVWLVGEGGAILLRPGGRRALCYCAKASDASLPPSDRIAHLLLALREDEPGFATVANLVFAGAVRRVRQRLSPSGREALATAVREARTVPA